MKIKEEINGNYNRKPTEKINETKFFFKKRSTKLTNLEIQTDQIDSHY